MQQGITFASLAATAPLFLQRSALGMLAPEGSMLNALPPSPTGGRHIIGHFVVPLVFGALAEAVPGRVQADCGLMNLVTFQGRHRDGWPRSPG